MTTFDPGDIVTVDGQRLYVGIVDGASLWVLDGDRLFDIPADSCELVKGRNLNQRQRRALWIRVYRAVYPQIEERSGGLCEVKLSVDCKVRASQVHHAAAGQLRGDPRANLPRLLHASCEPCHSWLHAHSETAEAAGVLIRDFEPALIHRNDAA